MMTPAKMVTTYTDGSQFIYALNMSTGYILESIEGLFKWDVRFKLSRYKIRYVWYRPTVEDFRNLSLHRQFEILQGGLLLGVPGCKHLTPDPIKTGLDEMQVIHMLREVYDAAS